jgi:hypothetical protein
MKSAVLAAILAAGLAGGALAAFAFRPMPLYPAPPARAFEVLGEIAVASAERPPGRSWEAHHVQALAAAARARFGRDAQALVAIRHEVLPDGRAGRSTARAVAWANKSR